MERVEEFKCFGKNLKEDDDDTPTKIKQIKILERVGIVMQKY